MSNDLNTILAKDEPLGPVEDEPELNVAPDPEPTPEPTPEPEPQNVEPTGDTDAAPPAEPTLQMKGLLSAKQDEVAKRQAVEAQNTVLVGQMAEMQRRIDALQPKQEQPGLKLFEHEEDNAALNQYLDTVVTERTDGVRKDLINQKVNMSYAMHKGLHDDFDKVMEVWPELVQQNPALYEQAVADHDPGGFAYRACKSVQTQREMGDPKDFEARIRADEREKYAAELKGTARAAVNVHETLATEPTVAARNGEAFTGPTPLAMNLNMDKARGSPS